MRKFAFIIFSSFIYFSLNAQDITSVFPEIPETILIGLNAGERDKLISNPTDTSSIEISSEAYPNIKRLDISGDYISLQTSSANTIQIKLLPRVNNTQIICVVNTVCAKACDSYIRFYTTDWQLLENEGLFPPVSKDWFIRQDTNRQSESFVNAYAALDMTPVKIELNPDDLSLKVLYDIVNYLSEEDFKKIEPFLVTQPKVFMWDNVSFK